ncbi:MAG: LacI family DNA-binding transcriptional regulator [Planctomycetota bacterium]|nr:LacI family DNA-binding transcriptional regulator [Planctomycetota bacterium]
MAVLPKRPMPRVTMAVIAERAGVSRSTASFVINGRDKELKISAETCRRVLDVVRELNYLPDVAARTLLGQKTRTIGILWSLSGYNPIVGMVNSLTLMAAANGYRTFLIDHLNDAKKTAAALEDLASRRVDAIVMDADRHMLTDPKILALLRHFVAVVAVSNEPIKVPCDLVVHRRGPLYEQAARYLLRSGRRRLAIAMPDVANHDLKVDAVRNVLAEAGHSAERLIEIRFHVEFPGIDPLSGQERLVDALEARFPDKMPFDALMCASDEDAAYCVQWFQNKGMAIPDDMAIVGANDTLLGRILRPQLATGHRHNEGVSEAIRRFLFARLDNSLAAPQTAVIDMEFVCRKSAG